MRCGSRRRISSKRFAVKRHRCAKPRRGCAIWRPLRSMCNCWKNRKRNFAEGMEHSMPVRFKKEFISAETFESAAAFDVDNDGVPDIVSGGFWYKGPDFRHKHAIAAE